MTRWHLATLATFAMAATLACKARGQADAPSPEGGAPIGPGAALPVQTPPPSPGNAPPSPSSGPAAPTGSATSGLQPDGAPAQAAPDAASSAALASDAGAGSCRTLRGPVELPTKGSVLLSLRSEQVDCTVNDDGRPRTVSFASQFAAAPQSGALPERVDGGVSPGLTVPCAAAGGAVFCPDRTGGVHRAGFDGSEDRVVASSRSGSRVAAALLEGHVLLAYIASRRTSEGWVSEAWLTVDDGSPQRLSEDGSGATSVAFAEYKSGVLAVSVDARTALTAMHARPIGYDGHVKLGEDAVVFVGGPGDRRTGVALAVGSDGTGWSLLPIAKDVGSFGLAVVRLDFPPRVDEPVVWSMYANGLDPAPIAAARGAIAAWVARVAPQSAEPGARRVLQLGMVDAQGGFVEKDRVPTNGNASNVALALDARGALWVGWLDTAGAWVERLSCR